MSIESESEQPRPLRRSVAPPKPFPFHALGDTMGPAAKRISEVIKAPEGMCGQSILAAAALTNQAHADVVIDGRRIPLSLNAITVANSGERKTGVDKLALCAIREKQKELLVQYEHTKLDYEEALAAWKSQRAEIRKDKQMSQEAKDSELDALGPMPKEPKPSVLLMEEPTPEGLVKQLQIGSPFTGIFADEGGKMIGGHGMKDENILRTCATLSSLWDGSPVTRIRAGEDAVVLYGRRVSQHLMIQEFILGSIFANPTLMGQGILARCLMIWPESTMGTRFYEAVNLNEDPDLNRFWGAIKAILDTPYPVCEELNELRPRDLPLDSEAKALWIHYHDWIEAAVGENGELVSIQAFSCKAAEQVLRIAGNIALIENLQVPFLTAEHVQAGIELMQYYLSEAMRIYEARLTEPDILLAETLLNWLHNTWLPKRGQTYISLTQVYQYGPPAIRNAQTASRIMRVLEEHGWVVPLEYSQRGAARPTLWGVRV
jgi:hypothetical protein